MINRALNTIRVFHEINQKELAEKLKISRSYISEIESGKKKPSLDLIQQYSKVFDVPVSNIFLLSEFLEKGKNLDIQIVSPKIALMLKLIHEKEKLSKSF